MDVHRMMRATLGRDRSGLMASVPQNWSTAEQGVERHFKLVFFIYNKRYYRLLFLFQHKLKRVRWL